MANSLLGDVPKELIPKHIGIIMDGNGRWAKKRGLPRSAGHKRGAEVFKKIAQYCREIGVKYLTVYAFSTENWQRPPEEVNEIMNILRSYLKDTLKKRDENAKLCFLGDRTPLDEDLCEMMETAQRDSENNDAIQVNIALNYGGRDEIVNAVRALSEKCISGEISLDEIDTQAVSNSLYTAGIPDPDLIIRPSGEYRVSNFLLWQSAYSEYIFMDVLWPDFTSRLLDEAILQYLKRSRRFGGV